MDDPAQSYLVVLLIVALISLAGQGISAWLSSRQVRAIGDRQNKIADKQLELDRQRHEQARRSALSDRQAAAYVDLIAEANEQYNRIWDFNNEDPSRVPRSDWLEPYSKASAQVELFGSDEARQAARALGVKFIDWSIADQQEPERSKTWEAYMALVEVIRRDVGAAGRDAD